MYPSKSRSALSADENTIATGDHGDRKHALHSRIEKGSLAPMQPTRHWNSATGETTIDGVPEFWERVDSATAVLLMLDYDGTLAPFHVDRMKARPLPAVIDALHGINSSDSVSISIVSGRPVAEVLALLGDHGFTVCGSHGYEVYSPPRGLIQMPISDTQSAILDAAFSQAAGLFDSERIERKPASVAVHFRGLEREDYVNVERELGRLWLPTTEDGAMELRPFNGGLELRAAGRTKGAVVEEMLGEADPHTLAIYIGDDDTDEDAFAALPADGIGIKVGPSGSETLARGRLPDCRAVEQLLIEWDARRKQS